MKRKGLMLSLIAALAVSAFATGASAQEKFPFRLNWTLYGEHAPFFVALDKGFYKEEGLDVEILEGSGSTTVAQLVANATSPVAYVDAATMMRGVSAGMPIRAVGVTLQNLQGFTNSGRIVAEGTGEGAKVIGLGFTSDGGVMQNDGVIKGDFALMAGDAAGVVAGGKFAVIGGGAEGSGAKEVWAFDGTAWQAWPDLPAPRRSCAAVLHDGAVFVLGGLAGNGTEFGTATRTVWRARPGEAWTECAPLPDPLRFNLAVGSLGGRLLAAGGCTPEAGGDRFPCPLNRSGRNAVGPSLAKAPPRSFHGASAGTTRRRSA